MLELKYSLLTVNIENGAKSSCMRRNRLDYQFCTNRNAFIRSSTGG